MRQLIHDHETGEVRIVDVPAPAPRREGCVVRTTRSLVSAGTERAAVSFARASLATKARKRPDLVRQVLRKAATDGVIDTYRAIGRRLSEWTPLGYSSAGVVLHAGSDVHGLAAGDRVACAGGGFATHSEVVYVPKNLLARVPENVTDDAAAFATVGSIALHGIHRANVRQGETVGVIGLGLIGILTTQILRAYGHPVLAVDVAPEAVERARAHGATQGASDDDAAADRALQMSDGRGLDAVIVTAASESSAPTALAARLCRLGGTVCVVGDVGMSLSRRTFYEKELDLVVARSYGFGRHDRDYEEAGDDYPIEHVRWTIQRNMAEFLRLLGEGLIDVTPLIAARTQIERAPDLYQELVAGKIRGGTILIEYATFGDSPSRVVDLGAPPPGAARETVGIALVGAGNFARATLLPALRKVAGATLVSVVASGGTHATQAAVLHGARSASTDAEAAFADASVDLVAIATRHDHHAPLTLRALEAGKDVFVEKPLALDRRSLAEVVSAARASGRRLQVGFNRRHAPMITAIREHFRTANGPIMMCYRVNAGPLAADHWLRDPVQGGGRIIGEVCHFVDTLQAIADAPIVRVHASGGSESVPAEDHFVGTLDFANGSRGVIIYTAAGPLRVPKERLEVLGGGRAATLDNYRRLELIAPSTRKVRRSLSQDKGHRRQLEALVRAIREGRPAPVPLSTTAATSLATLCLVESLERGAPVDVRVEEILPEWNSAA